MILAACVAYSGFSACAAVASSCYAPAAEKDGVTLLKTCAPELTFYAPGATAMKITIQATLLTTSDSGAYNRVPIQSAVFDITKPVVTINMPGNYNAYAYYGYGAAGKSYAGKRVAVIFNHANGSMAGVNQLLTNLKTGTVQNSVEQQEYITVKLHTAADQKAGITMPAADVTVTNASALAPVVTLAATRVADFKTAWGMDKQKVAHMAFSDVRPSEFTPGLIARWDSKAFPSETIAMQGFGVVVNNNMYKALMARDVREGQITDVACDSSDASMLLAKCQPGITSADYAALMNGKITSAAEFLRDSAEPRILTLNRYTSSHGTQIATQIMFAGQANYAGKTPLATGFDMVGLESPYFNRQQIWVWGVRESLGFIVITNLSTVDLIFRVSNDESELSIGVASLVSLASFRFGPNANSATPKLQTARWVKLDRSPNFKPDGTVDSTQRAGLQVGYPFAFEFQALKSAKLTGYYSALYADIVNGLKDPANNPTGIAYIGSPDASKNTVWTRGGNNYFPLGKY